MPIFKIHHITKYEYDRAVRESVNEVKIFPVVSADQETLSYELAITGQPDVQIFNDYWGNKTGVFNLMPLHKQMIIESKSIVRTTAPSQLRINFHGDFEALENEKQNDIHLIELADSTHIASQAS